MHNSLILVKTTAQSQTRTCHTENRCTHAHRVSSSRFLSQVHLKSRFESNLGIRTPVAFGDTCFCRGYDIGQKFHFTRPAGGEGRRAAADRTEKSTGAGRNRRAGEMGLKAIDLLSVPLRWIDAREESETKTRRGGNENNCFLSLGTTPRSHSAGTYIVSTAL